MWISTSFQLLDEDNSTYDGFEISLLDAVDAHQSTSIEVLTLLKLFSHLGVYAISKINIPLLTSIVM